MKRITMLLGAGVLLFCSTVFAAVPQLINFQGVLKDSAGNTPAVDMLGVTFTIYDAPLGGTALWTETQSITIADEGRFNVLLGSSNPIPDSVFADTVRYIGIQVESDPEMLPRQRLASVAYAYQAKDADVATLAQDLTCVSCVSAAEVADEPGVASDINTDGSVLLNNTIKTLAFRTITAPAAGYALVIGTAAFRIEHTSGTLDVGTFGVSNAAGTFPPFLTTQAGVPSSANSGPYRYPVTVQGLFSVAAGSSTFYLLGQITSGQSPDLIASNIQLSVTYFPTGYGTVDPALAVIGKNVPEESALPERALTAAEEAEAEKFNALRIAGELAEVKARMQKLEEQLQQKIDD